MRPSTGTSLGFLALASLAALAACGASTSSAEVDARASTAPTASGGPAEVPTSDPTTPFTDAGAVLPFAQQGLVVVNASRRAPAFRICKADAMVDASNSPRRPFPTTRMPGSSLAGVDINGAVRLDPADRDVADIGADTSVLVLFIDADTKSARDLATASCKSLACSGGGVCFGSAKMRRAEIRQNGSRIANGFGSGHILVLRDDAAIAGAVYFDVIDMPPSLPPSPGAIRFDYKNFSDTQAKLTFKQGSDVDDLEPDRGTVVAPTSFDSQLAVGPLTVSLATLHSVSEPTTDIEAFYGTAAPMGLYLLGLAQPGVGDEPRALKLVAVPYAKPAADVDGGVSAR